MKTNNPVSKHAKRLLIGLLVLFSSLIFLYPQLFNCGTIGFSGFVKMDNQIFVSPDIKSAHLKKIKKIIRASEMRVDSFYGEQKSKPVIIICSNTQQYEKYCSSTEGAGCSLGTPWGSSYVVLNTDGLNVDVVSHEMSHTELLKRLGWWEITINVPQWFNEGVALMLDKRFVNNPDAIGRYLDYTDEWLYYTGGGQEILELEDIASIKGFFGGGQRYVMLAYMTSGLEVSYWLIDAEKNALHQFADYMDRGLSFKEAYKRTERLSSFKRSKQLPINPLRLPDDVGERD